MTRFSFMSGKQTSNWLMRGVEPSVHELMADPIFELLLKRDGLDIHDVWRTIEVARAHLCERVD